MLTFGTVICTYNRPHLLERCLEAWNASNRLPDQLIIVDATVHPSQYSSDLIQRFPRLFASPNSQYIFAPKPGLTTQRNLGLKQLQTDIVCFVDDDAFITPTYIDKILEVFQQDSAKTIGGVNGTAIGQFDNGTQKKFRLAKNYARDHFGWLIQRIYIPRDNTKLFEPITPELQKLPLISIDRLWGANMNYRTELIQDSEFDESFQRYGLFEDVDMSVRVGKTHKLVCRLDAEIIHDDTLGQSTRPNDARYFLASWVNSAYIIEKLFPCAESRNSHQRLFKVLRLAGAVAPPKIAEKKIKTLGAKQLIEKAREYISILQSCDNQNSLSETFIRLQSDISTMEP